VPHGLPSSPALLQALALVANPKQGLQQWECIRITLQQHKEATLVCERIFLSRGHK